MRDRPWRKMLLPIAAATTAPLFALPVLAQSTEFYARRSVSLYIGFDAGGGYDLYGRLVARHLGRHLAGSPTLIPQNMPGAAGLKVVNYMAQAAPRDGTALAIAAEALALEQAMASPGTDYDAARLGWIGRISPSASVTFTWHTSPSRNIADARRRETVIGASGVTGITSYTPRALNRLADTRFKLVTGYSGSASVLLAMERGEVEGGFGIWPEFKQQKPEWIAGNMLNMLYVVAARRSPDLPDVPTTGELGTTPEARDVLGFLATTTEVGRAFFTAPGVPSDRLTTLRGAFQAMIVDADFKRDAERSGLRVEPLRGEELEKLVNGVVGSPRSLVEKAKAARS